MNSLSGVNASGPLIIRLTPASAIAGTRRIAPAMICLEPRPVGREELAVEVGRDAVERPRRGVPLVAAHAQPADLLAEVDEVVRVAQLGQAGVDALDRLGEEVLVGHRDDRDRHARQPADLRREHAAGVDHDVGCDRLAPAVGPRPRRRSPGHARRADRRRPGCGSGSARHASGPRRRAPGPDRTGRASRRSAARRRRGRRRSTSAGSGRAPPPAEISSSGSPNVLAQPAWRWSSSKRALDDASRSDPTSCHDGSTPVSSRSRR